MEADSRLESTVGCEPLLTDVWIDIARVVVDLLDLVLPETKEERFVEDLVKDILLVACLDVDDFVPLVTIRDEDFVEDCAVGYGFWVVVLVRMDEPVGRTLLEVFEEVTR